MKNICAKCQNLNKDNKGFICIKTNLPSDLRGTCEYFELKQPKKKANSKIILFITFLVIMLFSIISIINRKYEKRKESERIQKMFKEVMNIKMEKIKFLSAKVQKDTMEHPFIQCSYYSPNSDLSEQKLVLEIKSRKDQFSALVNNHDSIYIQSIVFYDSNNIKSSIIRKQEGFIINTYKKRYYFPQNDKR